MKRTHRPAKKYVELLPASLLPFKKEWRAVSRNLPAGTCLIILPDHNPRIEGQMMMVVRAFESQGRKVEMLREADLYRAKPHLFSQRGTRRRTKEPSRFQDG